MEDIISTYLIDYLPANLYTLLNWEYRQTYFRKYGVYLNAGFTISVTEDFQIPKILLENRITLILDACDGCEINLRILEGADPEVVRRVEDNIVRVSTAYQCRHLFILLERLKNVKGIDLNVYGGDTIVDTLHKLHLERKFNFGKGIIEIANQEFGNYHPDNTRTKKIKEMNLTVIANNSYDLRENDREIISILNCVAHDDENFYPNLRCVTATSGPLSIIAPKLEIISIQNLDSLDNNTKRYPLTLRTLRDQSPIFVELSGDDLTIYEKLRKKELVFNICTVLDVSDTDGLTQNITNLVKVEGIIKEYLGDRYKKISLQVMTKNFSQNAPIDDLTKILDQLSCFETSFYYYRP